MALTKKGNLKFGITYDDTIAGKGLAVAPYWIPNLTSAERTSEATTNVVAKNTTGEVVAQVTGNVKNSMKLSGMGDYDPSVGETMKVAGKQGLVVRKSLSASNEDFVKYSLDIEGCDGITY